MRNTDHYTISFLFHIRFNYVSTFSLDSPEKPVTYFSRKLTDREQRYAVVELECLAVILVIKVFEGYLIGKPFLLPKEEGDITEDGYPLADHHLQDPPATLPGF